LSYGRVLTPETYGAGEKGGTLTKAWLNGKMQAEMFARLI